MNDFQCIACGSTKVSTIELRKTEACYGCNDCGEKFCYQGAAEDDGTPS